MAEYEWWLSLLSNINRGNTFTFPILVPTISSVSIIPWIYGSFPENEETYEYGIDVFLLRLTYFKDERAIFTEPDPDDFRLETSEDDLDDDDVIVLDDVVAEDPDRWIDEYDLLLLLEDLC